MAADPPLNHLVLAATSVADDVGFVALADLATTVGGGQTHYRVIGGHMVTALAARWGLGADLHRETGDTDLGVPPFVVEDHDIVGRLRDLGYHSIAGNRFARQLGDIPAGLGTNGGDLPAATIDVLIPAYTSRARQSRRVGDDLVTTEVPGLALALQRPPVELDLEMHRLNDSVVRTRIAFPDEVSALILKGHARTVRSKPTDIVDLWRCLEIGLAAGLSPGDFNFEEGQQSVDILQRLFEHRDGVGMTDLITEQRLSERGATTRFTRIRALLDRVTVEP